MNILIYKKYKIMLLLAILLLLCTFVDSCTPPQCSKCFDNRPHVC